MIPSKYLTRKEVAALLEMSCCMVTSNEKRLGLLPFKIQLNKKIIRYKRKETLEALKKQGYDV